MAGLTILYGNSIVDCMETQETIEAAEMSSQTGAVAIGETDIRAEFSSRAGEFGAVLLESSLSAYGRGGRTFVATYPVAVWAIEHDEPIPTDWMNSLDAFLADTSAFYALFFSYDFGSELVAGEVFKQKLEASDSAKQLVPEYKAIVLKYSHVQVTEDVFASVGEVASVANRARMLSKPDRELYRQNIARIKSHIREGDIYQANLTAEWTVESEESPWDVYRRLQRLNPCQYGGYANLGDYTVLSSTPERLVSVKDRIITANPIKGTIAVGVTESQTAKNRQRLVESEKDRAELLIIVDLLRNDLGKICQTGSVKTPTLWSPEIYSSLIHLVAEINGRLREDVTTSQIIDAVFPGGSITGAPKRRAIRILSEIESRKRGIYTGSFGYKYGSELDLNIAIRTLTYVPKSQAAPANSGVYYAQAGGGIVADSEADSEYEEAALKVSNLLKAIGPELRP